MKHAAIIRLFQRRARERRLLYGPHARDEMDIDGETERSVEAVLCRARSVTLQENGRWKVRGSNLTVILHIEGETVYVLTVYAG